MIYDWFLYSFGWFWVLFAFLHLSNISYFKSKPGRALSFMVSLVFAFGFFGFAQINPEPTFNPEEHICLDEVWNECVTDDIYDLWIDDDKHSCLQIYIVDANSTWENRYGTNPVYCTDWRDKNECDANVYADGCVCDEEETESVTLLDGVNFDKNGTLVYHYYSWEVAFCLKAHQETHAERFKREYPNCQAYGFTEDQKMVCVT